jgi:uncharacterized protein
MAEGTNTSSLSALDEKDCWALLASQQVGRLVVIDGTRPDIFPVNYLVDDGEIVVRTAEGTKLAAAIMIGEVAFEIDEINADTQTGWSVVVHGTARESHTLADAMHDDEIDPEPWASGEKARTIHIAPTDISGRTLQPDHQQPDDSEDLT